MPKKTVLLVNESISFLINEKKRYSGVNETLDERIFMLIRIKRYNGNGFYISSLANDLQKDRETIRNWIKKYKKGGLKELKKGNYENINRSSKRENWVVSKEMEDFIVAKLPQLNRLKYTKNDMMVDLNFHFEVELNESTFYKAVKRIENMDSAQIIRI
jgi:transposase